MRIKFQTQNFTNIKFVIKRRIFDQYCCTHIFILKIDFPNLSKVFYLIYSTTVKHQWKLKFVPLKNSQFNVQKRTKYKYSMNLKVIFRDKNIIFSFYIHLYLFHISITIWKKITSDMQNLKRLNKVFLMKNLYIDAHFAY